VYRSRFFRIRGRNMLSFQVILAVRRLIQPTRKYGTCKRLISFDPEKSDLRTFGNIFYPRSDYAKRQVMMWVQYRSEIFYHNELQKKIVRDYIDLMTTEDTLGSALLLRFRQCQNFTRRKKCIKIII
jgi:hypothetical protein